MSRRTSVIWLAGVVFVLGVLVAGCGSSASATTPPTVQTVNRVGQGQYATPPCGPAAPTHRSGLGGTLSVLVPSNTQTLTGFAPLLPGHLPSGFTWNFAYLQARPASGNAATGVLAPLFHAGYRTTAPNLKTYNPAPHSLLSLDESSSTLAPETALFAGVHPVHVLDSTPITINGASGTLAHLGADASGPHITALVWHAGSRTLRLTASQNTTFSVYPFAWQPAPNELTVDTVDAWSAMSDGELKQVAQSVAPYSGCPSK